MSRRSCLAVFALLTLAGSRCRYDGGAVHNAQFTLNMLNVLDFFHSDPDGQSLLAEVTYPGNFDWGDP